MGICERVHEGKLEACRIVFGAEPKDYEVYAYILNYWNRLDFSPAVEYGQAVIQKVNPKRMRRQINAQIEDKGIGTKAQQALKAQHEMQKKESRKASKENRDAFKEKKFEIKQEKKKEKHKGH